MNLWMHRFMAQLDIYEKKSKLCWHITKIINSFTSTLAIVNPLDFFAQSNCYTFLETLGYLETFQICLQFFFYFCTIYRPEQNDIIKPFFLVFYSSGQDTMLKFCTLTNTPKGYRSKKKFQDGSHYVYFTDQNRILPFWSVKYASLKIFKFPLN